MLEIRLFAALCVAFALVVGGRGATAAPRATEPSLWFAPLPPLPMHASRPYVGSPGFMRLFSPAASWRRAAEKVSVFKLYGEWVAYVATPRQLRQVVADLRRRRIALAVEAGPLDPKGCGQGVEGFAGLREGLMIARAIKAAGGSLRYLAFDEPFYFASIYSGTNACHWDAERVAREVASYVRGIRSVFPKVVFGDTEPILSPTSVDAYEQWVDAYRRVTGSSLGFLHLDFDFAHLPQWPSSAQELARFVRSRGLHFGIIYMGDPGDATGARWLRHAQDRFELYESQQGRSIDDALLQSWHDQPDELLPETSANAFTNLVLRYARPRSLLRAQRDADQLSGRLTDPDGHPLPAAPIRLSLVARNEGSAFPASQRPLGTVSTDPNGRFAFSLAGLPPVGASVVARYPGSERRWPSSVELPLGPALQNSASGASVSASFAQPGQPPALAVDGDPSTFWSSDFAPQWIEIDLGRPRAVAAVRLEVEQTPSGDTDHLVLAGPGTEGELRLLHEFRGTTSSFDLLEHALPQPLEGIRFIRIQTISSPSWVGWREIEVLTIPSA